MISILIPTFNRSEFLVKNLLILEDAIIKIGQVSDIVEIDIIISDNASTDNTQIVVKKFIDKASINVCYYLQPNNIGLERNALFVLEKSTAKFVMYLGDDDFISFEYLYNCINILKKDSDTSVIIPNFIPVTVDGVQVGPARDMVCGNFFFSKGFKSALANGWKGHQLSGLVLLRKNLLKSYYDKNVQNIYLFIYFVSFSCLNGNAYLVTENPIEVTQPIKKKDWSYGEDGLLNEVFDNFKKLPISNWERFLLEYSFLKNQYGRIYMYKKFGGRVFFKALTKIMFAKNASILFSIAFPCIMAYKFAFGKLIKFFK